MRIVEQYLLQLKTEKRRWRRAAVVLTALSLLVAIGVSWNLRMTGITLVNDACCGYEEHQHTEACLMQTIVCGYDEEEQPAKEAELSAAEPAAETDEDTEKAADEWMDPMPDSDPEATEPRHVHVDACYQIEYQCGYDEHLHSIACYSNPKADVETLLDWQELFEDYPYTGDLREDLVGVAKTQVGYAESSLNFEADDDEVRHGYTRYGAWYGAPYNEWSAMFVSFCLSYAGADLNEYPISSGADTMAGLWDEQGKYVPGGQYIPVRGDLVFFEDNTVGIVAEVQNATIYVIGGNVEDAVSGTLLSLNDDSIDGWGVIEDPLPEDEGADEDSIDDEVTDDEATEDEAADDEATDDEATDDEVADDEVIDGDAADDEVTDDEVADDEVTEDEVTEDEVTGDEVADDEVTEDDLFDVSEGPAVFIFEGDRVQLPVLQMQQYALGTTRITTDLIAYLNANEGSYFFTLLDFNNVELPKDEQGNYIAQANQDYKLSIGFNSPKGFPPGTYQYQVPNGLMVDGGEGTFILKDGTNVGSWVVTDTGLITLVFNENMNSRTDITISVALGIHFTEQEEPIDFDGKITVTVTPPPQQQFPTQLYKWGQQGSAEAGSGQDPTKLYWTVQIVGNKDSQIPGNILSDRVLSGEWSKDHRYTASDIAGGLTFGVSEPDPVTGEFKDWHSWHVPADDPHLLWTETGWSYKMPQTVTCQWCGEVELGNENWVYTVNYTSTPDPAGTAGTYGYENEASIDGQHAYAWTDFTHGETSGEITKTGAFVSDAGGGNFVWEFQATIPGMKQGQKADYHWYIMDYMYLINKESHREGYLNNDANLASVTVDYKGTAFHVPRVQDATEDDLFAWDNTWTANSNGIDYGQEFNLLYRCHCTAETCPFWSDGCGEYWFERDDGTWDSNGFCQCWTVDETVTFTFSYMTDALPVIERYGGLGYQVQNVAELYYKPGGTTDGALVSNTHTNVTIPGMFKKELTHDFDGYTAHYQITVNEAKAALTNGSALTIHDVMTETLAYISGSLVVTAEDANGDRTTLQQGVHYTVTYDGTGNETDQAGNSVHVLDVVILKPQPVTYILDYDATLIMPEHVTGAIRYNNSASVTLWGKTITTDSAEKVYADINIAAKSYAVELFKISAATNQPLANAVFGLYNAQGGLIASRTTDAAGYILFRTNITKGIILREHELYYLQEIHPPQGYLLDDTKHCFVFCNSEDDTCETCREVLGETDGVRIPSEQIGKVYITNQLITYELPSTGGPGIFFNILCGLILVSAPLVYGFSLRRKHERRSRE